VAEHKAATGGPAGRWFCAGWQASDDWEYSGASRALDAAQCRVDATVRALMLSLVRALASMITAWED